MSWRNHLASFTQQLGILSGDPWHPYPHLVYIADRVMAAMRRPGGGRVIVNMPPRHGKSRMLSHGLPVMFLEACPELNVILASYEATFASDWGRRVRDSFASQELWTNVRQDVSAANRWVTPDGGGMVTAGVGGPITGRGGHLIIIDDPYKNWEQAQSPAYRRMLRNWYKTTLRTRAEPGATIVVVQTRWHQDDLTGWLLKDSGEDWDLVALPAIAETGDPLGRMPGEALCPERYSIQELQRLQTALGPILWPGLYQQRPVPAEGTIIRPDWIRHYEELGGSPDLTILSWDMSFKDLESSSWVVGQCWSRVGPDAYLRDQLRDRLDFVRSLAAMESMHAKWPEAMGCLVEDRANGPAVLSMLRRKIPGLIPVNPHASKESRLTATTPLWHAGNVLLPTVKRCPWVREYIDELVNFPFAEDDDQVDATSQALHYLSGGDSVALAGTIAIPDLGRSSPWRI